MIENSFIRNYQDGDEEKLVSLFNLAFSEYGLFFYRTKEEWLWRYKKYSGFLPEGIFQAYDGSQLIASVITTKRKFLLNNQILTCLMIDDVAVHPDYRGKKLAYKLEQEAVKFAEGRAELMWAYTGLNSISEKIFLSQGFKKISNIYVLAKVLNLKKLITLYGLNLFFMLFQGRKDDIIMPKLPLEKIKLSKKKLNFLSYDEEYLLEIIKRTNEFYEKYLGFEPRDEENWRWRKHTKKGFTPDWFVLLKERERFDFATFSLASLSFARSNKKMSISVLDDLVCEDSEIGVQLVKEATKRAKNAGTLIMTAYLDEKDLVNINILRNAGFRIFSMCSPIVKEIRNLNLGNMKKPFYIAKESLFGEP